MANLRDTVKDYQEELRDGIAWVAFWKTGRSWNAEYFHLEMGDILYPEDRSRMEEIKQLTITGQDGSTFRLGDIARIREAYTRTPRNAMYLNNQPAIGLAISTVSDGNVVDMAAEVKKVMAELQKQMPDGYQITPIYDQGYESDVANQGFIVNLILSVITVVAVLLFFIGIKNGFLIGSGLIYII